jgi:hypothetical protein
MTIDKNIEIAALTAKMLTIGELIHKLSNSLTQATPESDTEKRLISKIAAYTSDYNVYKDQIAILEKQIEAEKTPKTTTWAEISTSDHTHIWPSTTYSNPTYYTYSVQTNSNTTADNFYKPSTANTAIWVNDNAIQYVVDVSEPSTPTVVDSFYEVSAASYTKKLKENGIID